MQGLAFGWTYACVQDVGDQNHCSDKPEHDEDISYTFAARLALCI